VSDAGKDGSGNFVRLYWIYLLAGAVFLLTCYGLYAYPEGGKWHGVIEALFVAACLTLTVDPFVKTRVAREVNKDIFYHVIGFAAAGPTTGSTVLERRRRRQKFI
jgi:hypothetical protein